MKPALRLVQTVGARLRTAAANDFVRDTGKLVTGTIGGRLVALAALPLATRLYTPDDFATLATFLSIVSVSAVAACLRLDIAIPLADTDDDAANLLVLALLSALAVGVVLLLLSVAAAEPIAQALRRPDLAPYLWLIPLAVVMTASYSALQFWATRARRFGSIARTRITQALLGVGALLGLGWAGIAPLGLLIGNMLNSGAGGLGLGLAAWKRDRRSLSMVSAPGLRRSFSRNRGYAIYSAPEALANTAGIHLPVILIAAFAGAEAGFLLLATQIMAAPMALLGSSVSQVYMSRAAEEKQAGRLAPFTLNIVRRLIQIGVGPLIFVGVTAPSLFPLVFGDEWTRAGQIVTWLTPWVALQFVASPISTVLHLTGRQSLAMGLQFAGLAIRVGAVLAAGAWLPEAAVPAVAIAATAFYCLYLVIDLAAANVRAADAMRSVGVSLVYCLPWLALAALTRLLLLRVL